MIKIYGCYDKDYGTLKRLRPRVACPCPNYLDRIGCFVIDQVRIPYINFGLYYDTGLFEGCPSGVIGCEEVVDGVVKPVFEIEGFDSIEDLIAHCCNPFKDCQVCRWPQKIPDFVKVTFSGIEFCGPCIKAMDSIHSVHLPLSGLLNGAFLLSRSVFFSPLCAWELCLNVSVPWTRYTDSTCSGEVYSSGTLTKFQILLWLTSDTNKMMISMKIGKGFSGMGTRTTAILFEGARPLTSPRPRCINTDVSVQNSQTYCYFHVNPNNTYPKRLGINGTAYVEYVDGEPYPAWTVSKDYHVGDGVSVSGVHYVCYTAHISDMTNRPQTGPDWPLYWYEAADTCEYL
ncbi:MAG TPA: hypothetical protein PKY88_13145 [Anaerohalosphaeraceae bacterium]|nr:hypothetical protein [Anaerohalosphaeraceae bacterium]